MYSFILKRQPKSYNSWGTASSIKKAKYKSDIESSFRNFHPSHVMLNDDLYGTLFYLFKKDVRSDVDNLSKPLWDSLSGFLFADDQQVRLRIAGGFDLSKNNFNILDLSGLKGNMVTELLDAIDQEDHIVYVECGKLNYSMFKFNLEG